MTPDEKKQNHLIEGLQRTIAGLREDNAGKDETIDLLRKRLKSAGEQVGLMLKEAKE